MKPPKRQIIKTRPQRPYIVARIVLIVVVIIALVLAVIIFIKPHAAHAFSQPTLVALLQEAHLAARTAPVRAFIGHPLHANLR
jgi:flagellar basal body-associated protein FliL